MAGRPSLDFRGAMRSIPRHTKVRPEHQRQREEQQGEPSTHEFVFVLGLKAKVRTNKSSTAREANNLLHA
jgi:hypothetical protein